MVFRRNASHVYTGLSLTLVAQAACFPLFGSRSGTVPRPEPQGTAATPPPVAASQIAATVAVPIRWVQDTVNTLTIVEGNVTGTSGAEFQIAFAGLRTFVAGDFNL